MFQSVRRLPEELNTGKYDLFQLMDRLLKDVNMRMKLYHLSASVSSSLGVEHWQIYHISITASSSLGVEHWQI